MSGRDREDDSRDDARVHGRKRKEDTQETSQRANKNSSDVPGTKRKSALKRKNPKESPQNNGAGDDDDEDEHEEGMCSDNGCGVEDESGKSPVPHGSGADTSAYALLALMQSVHTASEASAADRGRTNGQRTTRKDKQRVGATQSGPAKRRKPTSTVRKEEITELHHDIQKLESRVAFLRCQSLASASAFYGDEGGEHGELEHPQIPNALLREAIHEQQLSLASARSMISQFAATDLSLPAHCYIHLTKSPRDRQHILQTVRRQQLRVARRYVIERSRHINLTVPHAASERFMKENGDACHIRFVISQFPGSLSVRDVFDAATFYTSNLEISFTDGAGHVTIREDDTDAGDPTMSQHRFLTTVTPELLVEGNLMLFTHFDEQEEYGIVTATFVDCDDLHPYRPKERIRQDITAILMITREKDQLVVRRLGHVRLHHSDYISVSNDTLQSLSEGLSHWGDALIKHAHDMCGP